MSVELLTAIFGGITTLFGLWVKYKTDEATKAVERLQERVTHLERALATSDAARRAALVWARQIRQWARDWITAHRLGETPPEEPLPPDLIKEEV